MKMKEKTKKLECYQTVTRQNPDKKALKSKSKRKGRKKPPVRLGKVPERGENIAVLEHGEHDWSLFYIPKRDPMRECSWKSLKLLTDKRDYKANYWLSWNANEQRLAKDHDSALLAEHDPRLMVLVVAACTAHWPSADTQSAQGELGAVGLGDSSFQKTDAS